MSYNGSGTFVINTAGQPVVSGTVISSTAFNALTADLATGLSTAITKDGQTTPTANIPMGNNKITNLAVGTAATDAANLSQVQSTTAKLVNSISGADTITGTMSPNLGAYATGQMFYFIAAGDNTGAVTLNIDSLGAKAVTRDGTTALAAGDIQSGEVCVVVYDGTRFQLVNGASQSASIVTENLTVNKATVLNESGGDNDTRIEGDTDANLFFVDASTDRVGVGTNAPVQKLDVDRGASNGVAARFGRSGGQFAHIYADTNSVYLSSDSSGNTSWEFNETNDYLAAWTGGTERLRVDASGNLGLGVTPGAWNTMYKAFQNGQSSFMSRATGDDLYINANAVFESGGWKYITSNFSSRYEMSGGTHAWFTAPSGTAGNTISFTQAMTLDSAGSLGIGVTSPGARLHVEQNTGSAIFRVKRTANDIFDIYQGSSVTYLDSTPAGGVLAFATVGTERARITAGGSLLVNTTTDNSQLYVIARANTNAVRGVAQSAGSVGVYGEHSSNSATGYAAYFYNTGSNTGLYISNTAAWQSASDERLKTDIKDIDSTDRLMQLRPRDYLWKSQETSDTPDKRNYGFIAQEVKEVFPDLVGVSPDGMFSVEYTGLIAPLVKAVQELKAELDATKAKVAALEAK